MKKALLTIMVAVTSGIFAFAQEASSRFVVNEVRGVMSQGEQIALEIVIPEVELKEVNAGLEKWAKSAKAKVIKAKNSSEIFIDNANLPSVSDNTVDIYAITSTATSGGVTLRTYIDLGGIFLSSAEHPQAFAAMEQILISFSRDQLILLADKNVKTEEKHLSDLESEMKSLIKNKASYEKDIRSNNDNIYKKEQEITKNEADQKIKEQQISLQQEIVIAARQKSIAMGASDPATKKMLENQVKTEEKSLKTLEGQLKSLRSDLSSAIKDIEKSKSTIAQREMDIKKNGDDQATKEQQIELQKKILDAVRQRRADIR